MNERLMELNKNWVLQNREEAGKLLSIKLGRYINTNSVVIAISRGGASVGYALAKALQLSLEVMPCRTITHPANSERDIGSVTVNEVFLMDSAQDIPREYLYRQINLLQNAIKREYDFYYGENLPGSLLYKTVIIVDDLIKSSEGVMACLRSIKKQRSLKIIVAVPVVIAEAARLIRTEVDDIVFLRMEPEINSGRSCFVDFPEIEEKQVRKLLIKAKNKFEIV